MGMITRHPLYQKADALKRAFLLHGFTLYDNGEKREAEPASANIALFDRPEAIDYQPILLEDGRYQLRTSLLPSQLGGMVGEKTIKAITCGRIYDKRDQKHPERFLIEGVIAREGLTMIDLNVLWTELVSEVYGTGTQVLFEAAVSETLKITIPVGETTRTLGYMAPANWLARTILHISDDALPVWLFTIEADALTAQDLGLASKYALYDPTAPFLSQCEDSSPCAGFDFAGKAANILRRMGYLEFIGEKAYTADAYVRMNMIQEAWDTNNQGVTLAQPLEGYDSELTPLTVRDGLPTVLTPALEQAMYENRKAGVESVKLFELAHIFKPGQNGKAPWEKISLSFGAYRSDLTFREFLAEVDAFLTQLGIKNHFFIPTGMAIAYRQDQCMVILDEKMKYMDGNCGHIAPKALANYKIDSEAFMAQFELDTLEKKAKEEYGFIPYEER